MNLLQLPFLADSSAVERTTFEWGNPMPAWLVFLAVVGMAALVVRAYRRETGGSSPVLRGVLTAIRLALVLAVFALICEPQRVTSSLTMERSTVAILIDRSRSMSLTDRYTGIEWSDDLISFLNKEVPQAGAEGQAPPQLSVPDLANISRMEIARSAARWLGERLSETHNVAWYAFDTALLRDVSPDRLEPSGTETHLGDALAALRSDLSGKIVSGIVVFTDGQSNGGNVTPEQAATLLSPPDGVPVFTVGIGDPTPPRDVWVRDLHAPERAIVNDTVVFDFVVGNYGFQNEQTTVELEISEVGREGGSERDHATVKLGSQNQRVKQQLRYHFERAGDYLCTVRVAEQVGEIDTKNNSAVHIVKIIDRRIKVLYVEGHPRWEYLALSRAMIRDRSLEAYCLLQSADIDFPQETTPKMERMRKFPPPPAEGSDEEDPLFDFDVVIIGDVALNTNKDIDLDGLSRDRLVKFVENVGGGLAFISGPSFNPAEYGSDESLRKLLPVVVEGGSSATASARDPYRLKLTPAGVADPILRLREDLQENREFIEGAGASSGPALPPFYAYFPAEVMKPTAQVLATHASAVNSAGAPYPIFALQQIGKGKVFWSATDEIWRWRRLIGDKFYYRFWGQTIRALAQGKLLGSSKRISLYTNRPEYTFGEQVEVVAEVLGPDYNPVSVADLPELEVLITKIDDETLQERVVLIPKMTPDGKDNGLYSGILIPKATGTFQVALGNVPDLKLGDGAPPGATFKVREPAVEMENPFMDEERLKAVAARTGDAASAGKLVRVHELPDLAKRIPPGGKAVPNDSIPPIRLWHPDHKGLLLLLLTLYTGLLTCEWIARKLGRML